MSRIIEAWEALQREALSRDYDEQQFAAFQIGLIMERHNPRVQQDDEVYEENLPRELQRLNLSDDRLRQAVDFLVAMVRSNQQTADTFLYALSRVRAELLLAPLLELMATDGASWSPDAAYHAAGALEQCLRTDMRGMSEKLQQNSPIERLNDWQNSADELLAERARKALLLVQKTLQAGG